MPHLIVDAANVMGSRPDGWWRDRPAAAVRLTDQLAAALAAAAPDELAGSEMTVHLVLEGVARQAASLVPPDPRLVVVLARADGDTTIAELAEHLGGQEVVVVTADRELRARVRAVGARTVGPRELLDLLGG